MTHPKSLDENRNLLCEAVCWVWTLCAGRKLRPGPCWRLNHHLHHYSSQHQSQLAVLRRPGATEGSSSDFRALFRPEVQYKAVEMSFLRRGNSCVTPDMEIRKRLEVSLKLLFLPLRYKIMFNAIFLSTTGAEIFRQGRQRRERESDEGGVVQCSQLFWSAHN